MTPGLIKLFNKDTLGVFIKREHVAATKSPAARWTPGVGQLCLNDELVDEPCLVSNEYCWTVVTPSKRHLTDLKVGQVSNIKITEHGLLVVA